MTKRVLICGLTKNRGGMESYVMNIYRNIDRDKLQFDFLGVGEENIAFSDEINQLGGRVFYLPLKREGIFKHYSMLKKVFTENEYVGVYYQTCHMLQSLDVFKQAKRSGIAFRALHSHSTRERYESRLTRIRRWFVYKSLDRFVNIRLACSDAAGKWMFKGRPFDIIKNSVDTSLFCYSESDRLAVRRELGLDDKIIIGTVAKLTYAKNPEFVVKVIESLTKMNENIVFVHIGNGELDSEIKEEVRNKNLANKYLFLGSKTDVYRYLNAIDVFILPSRFEGFPISFIEAQSSGVRCIVSDIIPKECDLTNNSVYLPVNNNVDEWAYCINNNITYERCDKSYMVKEKGYDVQDTIEHIMNLFGVEC
jgi:glycosyltransferase involved in cell wall biosynthesis